MKALIAFFYIRMRARDANGKYKKGKYSNLDHLEMPYGTLQKKFKIPCGSIAPAIDELLEKGFITIKHLGGTYRHDKTIYAWSDNWVIWREGVVFNTRNKDPKRGFQGKNLGAVKKILRFISTRTLY